jgi:molybdenum cofactor biosynthesis protein B
MSDHLKPRREPTVFALVITTDTRTEREDQTGREALALIEAEGHRVASHTLIPNDEGRIRAEVQRLLADPEVRVIVTSGGTGIGRKDRTVAAVAPLLEKEMPGFGELFRSLSYEEVGVAALMSRAMAGVSRGKLVFALPGSRGAVRTALYRIILPGVGHMLWEIDRS